jgi:hypothetical protein
MPQFTRIYLGKDAWCRCGCGGDYAEAGTRAFEVRRKRVDRLLAAGHPAQRGPNYVNLSLDNDRALCAYTD